MSSFIDRRSQHLLFIDECGTHDMQFVDPQFPVFVLLGLMIGETYYAKTFVPRVRAFKTHFLPNPDAVLHSYDIRRCRNEFEFLKDDIVLRQRFYEGLNDLIALARFRCFAIVIDKARLSTRYLYPPNPYNVSLSQLLSVIAGPPVMYLGSRPSRVKVIAEARGKLEDRRLQNEFQNFRRFGLSSYGLRGLPVRRAATVSRMFSDKVEFVRKRTAVAGLEFADLTAYPITRAVINDDWTNRAAVVIAKKLKALLVFP